MWRIMLISYGMVGSVQSDPSGSDMSVPGQSQAAENSLNTEATFGDSNMNKSYSPLQPFKYPPGQPSSVPSLPPPNLPPSQPPSYPSGPPPNYSSSGQPAIYPQVQSYSSGSRAPPVPFRRYPAGPAPG